MSFDNITAHKAPGSHDEDNQDPSMPHKSTPLNDDRKLNKLKDWWHEARTNQADNRCDQAIDDDFVDGIQWSDDDRAILLERGQSPLVFNEILPAVQWVLGTEKRTRLDYKVLPREDDDREGATTKTKLIKYIDDVNKASFARSRAFESAVRTGVGWLEIGVRADAEKEPIYVRNESWRNVWYDSLSVEPDLSDARYLFRSKIIDLDLAIILFPEKENALRAASSARDQLATQADDDFYDSALYFDSGTTNISDALGASLGQREVVRLVECWYREPAQIQIVRGLPKFEGMEYDQSNQDMAQAVNEEYSATIYNAVRMKVRIATFIDGGTLCQDMPTPYRHNRFPLIPVWGYRRGRDNAPYGVVRNARDPQEDLNKRKSKALFLLSVNRTVMDEGAVDNLDDYEEEAAKPNAIIVKKSGKELKIENNVQLAEEHVMLANQSADYVRQAGGVTGENLGMETNATSGKAILARQNQGSVTTASLFDNLRLAMQLVGENTLSLVEQFYSYEKIVRIAGERGDMEFIGINQMQDDGSMLNDITASQADFVISEQDHRESMRTAMFEQMMDMISKLDSQTAMSFLDLVFEWSDLPGKDEMVRRIRQINGQPDPDDPGAQEAAEQLQEQKAQESEQAAEMEQRTIAARISKDEAAASKTQADAQKTKVEAMKAALEAAIEMLQAPQAAAVAQDVLEGAEEARPGL